MVWVSRRVPPGAARVSLRLPHRCSGMSGNAAFVIVAMGCALMVAVILGMGIKAVVEIVRVRAGDKM